MRHLHGSGASQTLEHAAQTNYHVTALVFRSIYGNCEAYKHAKRCRKRAVYRASWVRWYTRFERKGVYQQHESKGACLEHREYWHVDETVTYEESSGNAGFIPKP